MQSMTHPDIERTERYGMPEGKEDDRDLKLCRLCHELRKLDANEICDECMKDTKCVIEQLVMECDSLERTRASLRSMDTRYNILYENWKKEVSEHEYLKAQISIELDNIEGIFKRAKESVK